MKIPAALPASATQTEIAKAYMTPETAKVLTDRVLDARIGNGTVAGGLNDALRFRVRGTGASRQIVPDNQLAMQLMDTVAGARLVQQLEVASRSADWSKKSNLTGFVLPRDTQAVAAAYLLGMTEPGGPPLKQDGEHLPTRPDALRKSMHEIYESSELSSRSAGATLVATTPGWMSNAPRLYTGAGVHSRIRGLLSSEA